MTMILVKLSLLLGLAVGLGLFLRRRQPALGHTLLMLLLCAAALIFAGPTLPRFQPLYWVIPAELPSRPVPSQSVARDTTNVSPPDDLLIRIPAAPELTAPATAPAGKQTIWFWLWMSGTALLALAWLLALWRSAVIVRQARPLSTTAQRRLGVCTEGQLDIRVSKVADCTFLWPGRRAAVIIPQRLFAASPEELRSLIAHELTHLQRGDSFRFLLARAVTLLLWFHPLAWWVESLSRQCAELACDDAAAGTDAITRENYASALLQLARRGPAAARGVGFAHLGGGLRLRIRQLLKPASVMWSRRSRVALGLTAGLFGLVAWAAQAVPQTTVPVEDLVAGIQPVLTPHRFRVLSSDQLQIATFYDGAATGAARVEVELLDGSGSRNAWLEIGPLEKFDHSLARRQVQLRPGVVASGRFRVSGVQPDGMVDGIAVAMAQLNAKGLLDVRRSRDTGNGQIPKTVCSWPLAFSSERIEALSISTPKWEMDTLYRLLCGADIVADGLHQI